MKKKQMYLPQELLSEVLSWLDVDSLLRFKTVCKEWCSLIEDRTFIRSHMMKSRGRWVFETVERDNYERYRFIDSYFGLILEHNYTTQYSRLRNPSTGKILEVPNPSCVVPTNMKMCHINSSGVMKLVYPCRAACKVMTVGVDIGWRDIDISSPPDMDYFYFPKMIREVYFMLSGTQTDDLEVICLEMGNERISRIKIPDSFFSDSTDSIITTLAWGERLALGSVIRKRDEVRIWVLEDHKKVRWAEKKITVPLKFVGPRDKRRMYIQKFHDNGLLMSYGFKEFLLLDVVSGKIRWRRRAPRGQEFVAYYYHVPSLQNPKRDETKH